MLAAMAAPEFQTLTADDLVTGEAVALDLPPASLVSRIVSGMIDILVTIVLTIVTFLALGIAAAPSDDALFAVAMIGALVTVFVAFPVAFETLTRGKSLGKLAMGLRTVRDDAGPITFQHALVRALVGFVEVYAFQGIPALISAMVSSKGKRLGDFAAGTYVVRERVSLRLPLPTPMPRELAGWAAGADMSALPTGLALAVRQFLQRAHEITPQARDQIGPRLAEQVAKHVSPPPPPGTPPWVFLAAVVASRRDRDLARLHREDALRRRLTTGA
jgi:uncharacterized RDD family membrane protein YckC